MKKIKDREKIPEMYESGLSSVEIGKRVGLSKSAVVSILKIRGIKRRTFREAYYNRWPKGAFGKKSPRWKGGIIKDKRGYFFVYSPNHPYPVKLNSGGKGYVAKHRLVMEKQLGRYLEKDEIVHHIDGNKRNNGISNLKITDRANHVKEHFKAVQEVARLQKILDKHEIEY